MAMPKPELVLWVYIVLLFLGGLMGFLRAKSAMSLIMSSVFAAVLVLCNLHIIKPPLVPDFCLIFLLLFFTWRLIKSKKMIPGGLMAILTLAALVLRNLPAHL